MIGGVEDICNARVTFANGCVANLTASRLAMRTDRKLRVFCPDAYVFIDYQKKHGTIVRRSGNIDSIRDAVARIRSGEVDDLSPARITRIWFTSKNWKADDVEPLRRRIGWRFCRRRHRNYATRRQLPPTAWLLVEVATRIVQTHRPGKHQPEERGEIYAAFNVRHASN